LFAWNASENVRLGLYGVHRPDHLVLTSLVVVTPPEPHANSLTKGGYMPHGVPLIKRVLALPDQCACRNEPVIVVDGINMGAAHERDLRPPSPRVAGLPLMAVSYALGRAGLT
jgi:type IV secretory pathway protease TraF